MDESKDKQMPTSSQPPSESSSNNTSLYCPSINLPANETRLNQLSDDDGSNLSVAPPQAPPNPSSRLQLPTPSSSVVAVNAQTKEQQIENDQLLAKSLEMELTREARAVRKSAARDFVGTVSPPPSPRMDPTRRVFYTAAQEAAARPRHLAEQRIHESAERHAARRERALERRLRRDSLDEEMAARLQVEWSQEAFERWARAADAGETDAAMASRLQNEWDSQHETDAEMARRLEAEWNMDVDVEPLATPTTARQAANAGEPMAVDLEASAAPDSSGTGLSVEELTMLEEEYGPDVWKPGFLKDLLGSLPDGGE